MLRKSVSLIMQDVNKHERTHYQKLGNVVLIIDDVT